MTDINPENGHGAADGFGGSDEESHLTSTAVPTVAIVGETPAAEFIADAPEALKAIADMSADEFMSEMTAALEEAAQAAKSLTIEQRQMVIGALAQVSAVLSEGLPRDTEAPPPLKTTGWLEQYAVFASEQLADLETLVLTGLTDEENAQLINVAAKLMSLAELKDSSAMHKLIDKVKG